MGANALLAENMYTTTWNMVLHGQAHAFEIGLISERTTATAYKESYPNMVASMFHVVQNIYIYI